jgi:hypothetical protein
MLGTVQLKRCGSSSITSPITHRVLIDPHPSIGSTPLTSRLFPTDSYARCSV